MPDAKKDAAQVEDVDVKETPEQILAAQQEGFAEADNMTSAPSKTVEKTAEQIAQEADAAERAQREAEAATAADEAKAAAEAASKPVLAGLTEAQLKDRLDKADKYDSLKASIDKVNGKFGSIEAKLKEMAEAKSAGVQMTQEDIADLETEYGPELAAALLKTLNKFGAKIGNAVKDDKSVAKPDEVQTKIDAAIKAAKDEVKAEIAADKQATELKFLSREHKDWRSIVQGEPLFNADGTPQVDAQGIQFKGLKPEFSAWVDKLPPADKKRLLESWDAKFLSDKIGEYKQHLATEAATKAAQEAEAKKQTTPPKRLSAAINPKSIPVTVTGKTALQEQQEGYASA
jgi:hypothetical protein